MIAICPFLIATPVVVQGRAVWPDPDCIVVDWRFYRLMRLPR